MLLLGRFSYGEEGILDRTHTRLFTLRSITQLFAETGLEVRAVRGIPAPIPKAIGDHVLSRSLLKLNELLIRVSPSLFSYQLMVVAKSRPSVRFVLEDAMRRADEHGEAAEPTSQGPRRAL
jgi:hypothetical protein